jgi:hypothetical protein
VELGGASWPGSSGGAGELGWLEVGDGADSWGPVVRETRERRPAQKARIKKEDVFLRRDGFSLWGQRSQWAGWAEIKKKNFRIKNWIFEFTKALDICRRRFRRNFDMRIFPEFF